MKRWRIGLVGLALGISGLAMGGPIPFVAELPVSFGADSKGGNKLDGTFLGARVYARELNRHEIYLLSRQVDANISTNALVWQGVPTVGETNAVIKAADFANGFTFACWVNLQKAGGRLFDNATPGGKDGIIIDTWPDAPRFLLAGNSTTALNHPTAFALGEPQCLVATCAKDGTRAMWLNGVRHEPLARASHSPQGTDALFYRQPAELWTQALPVGNGRLGAMAFGSVETDRLQLNENTIWTGGPLATVTEEMTREQVLKARELVFAGKAAEGSAQLPKNFRQTSKYQPFGDLVIRNVLPDGETVDYERSLSMDDAIARTTFTRAGITFSREVFASFTDDVVEYHLASDTPGMISFEATLVSPHEVPCTIEEGLLVVRGTTEEAPRARTTALAFEGVAAVRTQGGTVSVADGKIVVTGADQATLFVSIATNYKNFRDLSVDPAKKCRAALTAAMKVPYATAKKAHTAFYRAQADRCTLTLGRTSTPNEPTDEKLRAFAKTDDPTLAALYFRYARYLMISSSQPGTEPINLQGIWNKEMTPPWRSNYTLNINQQMYYWPAEAVGLGDLVEPMWRLCDELAVTGGEYARKVYGAEGWTAHHNSDPWRVASPCGPQGCGLWPTGGAWVSMHIWYHWLYTHDRDFLAGHYATLKGAADFLLSYLVRDPLTNKLTICPSISPENAPKSPDWPRTLTHGCAMDHAIVRDLFAAVAEATEILGGDAAYAKKLRETAAAVEPLHIGRWGQLQEWTQDLDNENDQHRHTSHLYALYPSNQITPETPDLFKAARVSLEHRGDESTGWALAWRMNLWARLGDAEHSYRFFRQMMRPMGDYNGYHERGGTYDNLFDACPPFVIDGNFGCLAGMLEMLLQTNRGSIDLLPALPQAWSEGRITGLRAPHGFVIEMVWMDHQLVLARIKSELGEPCTVRYAGKLITFALKKGQTAVLTREDFSEKKLHETAAHFWETRPLAQGGGFTWSMTTRLGDMLKEAELLFGPRDRSWTILGAEIRTDEHGVPQNWFPGYPARQDIVLQVVPPADKNRNEAAYQLAHEVVHVLAPHPGSRATVLEEGVATWFAAYYTRKAKGVEIKSSLDAYRQAHARVAQLLARDHQAIRKLRAVEPSFSRMTAETFKIAEVTATAEEIAALLAPFVRTSPEGQTR